MGNSGYGSSSSSPSAYPLVPMLGSGVSSLRCCCVCAKDQNVRRPRTMLGAFACHAYSHTTRTMSGSEYLAAGGRSSGSGAAACALSSAPWAVRGTFSAMHASVAMQTAASSLGGGRWRAEGKGETPQRKHWLSFPVRVDEQSEQSVG